MFKAVKLLAAVAVSAVIAAACTAAAATPTPNPTPSPTPTARQTPSPTPTSVPTPTPPMISGTMTPGSPNSPIAGRQIVLCLLGDTNTLPMPCTLTTLATTSDAAGHFEFATVPDGRYLVFYDSGWDDFNAGITKWTGKEIMVGDVQWLVDRYYTTSPTGGVNVMFPAGALLDSQLSLYRFFGEGPFFWAHTCSDGSCNTQAAVVPVQYDVTSLTPEAKTFPVYYHAQG